MARPVLISVSAAAVIALVAGVWATGGLRAAPLPAPHRAGKPLDLGRYDVNVTGALLHRQGGLTALDVTLRVTSEDRRSVLLQDLSVNALALETAGGPAVKPIRATGFGQGAEVNMLDPGVPLTVVLTYGLPPGPVPPAFHARMVFWGYDHREDFFYGHTQWKPRKPADANDHRPAEFAVPLPLRREGV